jgi:DNA-directed RNA polymerase subunit RPC12/RpoP
VGERGARKVLETVEGNCVVCNRRTRHTIRSAGARDEYFECVECGNRVDVKAFVYDNLDALS